MKNRFAVQVKYVVTPFPRYTSTKEVFEKRRNELQYEIHLELNKKVVLKNSYRTYLAKKLFQECKRLCKNYYTWEGFGEYCYSLAVYRVREEDDASCEHDILEHPDYGKPSKYFFKTEQEAIQAAKKLERKYKEKACILDKMQTPVYSSTVFCEHE